MAIPRARKALPAGFVGATAALAGIASLGLYAAPQAAAAADLPTAVEDLSYPDASRILADQKITLKRGDGRIVFIDCAAGTPDIEVRSRTGQNGYCFDVIGNQGGWITLELPDAFGIWTEAYPVKAKITTNGQQTVVNAPANDYTTYGEAGDSGTSSVLVELRVAAGTGPASTPTEPATQLPFGAKVNVGTQSSCSGTLVSQRWVLTSASCFAADGKPAAGKPTVATTVTVGRPDLTQTSKGAVRTAVQLVPHPNRDLVLLKLDSSVAGVRPVTLASTPTTAGQAVTAAGYGRTKTTWVPETLHAGTFTASSDGSANVSLAPSGGSLLCQGDAGGPVLRTVGQDQELVAITTKAGLAGCLGAPAAETRTGGTATRVDDVRNWVTETTFRAQGDMTGDRTADLAAIWGEGSLHVYTGSAQGLTGQRTQQYGDTTWSTTKQLVKGDFTDDGIADLMAVWNDGTLHLYKGDGKGNIGGPSPALYGGDTWGTVKQMTAGDFDGDGHTDLLAVWNTGTLNLYRGDGNGNIAKSTPAAMGGDTGSIWGTITQFVGGDFDRDGTADLMAVWKDGTLHFYKGKGDGNFNSHLSAWGNTTWSTVRLMAGDDYTADGAADLMAVWADGTLHLYKGDGKGNITPGIDVWGGTTWGTVKYIA
ncbi:FG-GAP-like repeat-containing protein [Streptomyces sp. NPDC093249]|uniref:FG-GAP-like repeat-containing protein n=1 Tax=unclassified Streptomyces TaxID=2593676 RepID=UPI0037FA6EE8